MADIVTVERLIDITVSQNNYLRKMQNKLLIPSTYKNHGNPNLRYSRSPPHTNAKLIPIK